MLRPSAGGRLVAIVRSQSHQNRHQLRVLNVVAAAKSRGIVTSSSLLSKEGELSGQSSKTRAAAAASAAPKPSSSSQSINKTPPSSAPKPASNIVSVASAKEKKPSTAGAAAAGAKPKPKAAVIPKTARAKSKVAAGKAAAGKKTSSATASRAQEEPLEEDEEEEPRVRRRKMRFGLRSRYQVRHPRYYRGPLHPHQPPHPSDPSSRVYEPGPFTSERLWDHYNDTLASDLMLLKYHHFPPNFERKTYENRLRKWEGESPYYENRPLRPPRGTNPRLTPVHRPITHRNVPKLEYIILHSFIPFAQQEIVALVGGGLVLQSISGVRPSIGYSKVSVTQWNFVKYKPSSLMLKIEGPKMYRFLANCIDIVMPRIKEFQGVDAKGDGKGTIMWGFTEEDVMLFPEIEVNVDSYPLKYIPGMHVHCVTSATNDHDARLLMSSFGLPIKDNINDPTSANIQ